MSSFNKIGDFVWASEEKEKQEKGQKEQQKQSLELMYVHQQYNGIIQNHKYVLRGSILSCSYGTDYSCLDLVLDHGIYNGNVPVLTTVDCGKANIAPFGSCLCPESNYSGRLSMNPGVHSDGKPARKAAGNEYAHICIPLIPEGSEWKQVDHRVMAKTYAKGYAPLLLDNAVLVCQYGGIIRIVEVPKTEITKGTGDYIERYPKAYIDGIIKAYETHKMLDGRFVLDNAGQTIGYGHDLNETEKQSGIYKSGLSMEDALKLAIDDLNSKYVSIEGYVKTLNSEFGYNIDANNFTENEILFLIDFAFNRGGGLVKRPELKASGKPYSSLAILIVAVSEKNDKKILEILMEETKNLDGVYYEGLKLRRMDQYEILKFGDFVRDYDVNRDFTKPKN